MQVWAYSIVHLPIRGRIKPTKGSRYDAISINQQSGISQSTRSVPTAFGPEHRIHTQMPWRLMAAAEWWAYMVWQFVGAVVLLWTLHTCVSPCWSSRQHPLFTFLPNSIDEGAEWKVLHCRLHCRWSQTDLFLCLHLYANISDQHGVSVYVCVLTGKPRYPPNERAFNNQHTKYEGLWWNKIVMEMSIYESFYFCRMSECVCMCCCRRILRSLPAALASATQTPWTPAMKWNERRLNVYNDSSEILLWHMR